MTELGLDSESLPKKILYLASHKNVLTASSRVPFHNVRPKSRPRGKMR